MKLTNFKKYNIPKLNEGAENLNRPITADQTDVVIKKLPVQKALELMVSQENFTKHFGKS